MQSHPFPSQLRVSCIPAVSNLHKFLNITSYDPKCRIGAGWNQRGRVVVGLIERRRTPTRQRIKPQYTFARTSTVCDGRAGTQYIFSDGIDGSYIEALEHTEKNNKSWQSARFWSVRNSTRAGI
jgi:hypothetical protein